jgi:predicted Rossmann fold nucleotide-binding protein DprA/Smf involved in DNA uptake
MASYGMVLHWYDTGPISSASFLPSGASACALASREAVEGDEALVLELLGDEPVPMECLIESSGLGWGRSAAAVLGLEVKGWARQLPGQRYVRSR